MANEQLRELFHQKKKKAAPPPDWAAKRDAWIAAVNSLYSVINNEYLENAGEDVEVSYLDKVMTETSTGEYHVREMVLRVGDEQVVFSPKGTNIVGARGRVDLSGDRGDATIVWQGDDRWGVVAARSPALRVVPLSADTLAEILRGIMRP